MSCNRVSKAVAKQYKKWSKDDTFCHSTEIAENKNCSSKLHASHSTSYKPSGASVGQQTITEFSGKYCHNTPTTTGINWRGCRGISRVCWPRVAWWGGAGPRGFRRRGVVSRRWMTQRRQLQPALASSPAAVRSIYSVAENDVRWRLNSRVYLL